MSGRFKYLLVFLVSFLVKSVFSVDIYYKLASFYIPGQGPYVETYFTVVGQSLNYKKVQGGWQNSVNFNVSISNDSGIVKASKYNLNGPVYSDTLKAPSFIDTQRYLLPNGTYTITFVISDVNSKQKPFRYSQVFKLNYNVYPLQASSIQVLESFQKATAPSLITKSGYDLIPFNVNYYPESQNKLCFYFESYNSDTVLGKGKPFIYKYFIENSESLAPVEGFSVFKKQFTAKANPLLGQFDITKLPTGNYNLVVEMRDEKNIIQMQEKYFFQRRNKNMEASVFAVSNVNGDPLKDYFNKVKSADTLKIFVECLWPISNQIDRERQINQAVKKDTALMRKYLVEYWNNRAADTANAMKMWMDYLKSVNETKVLFKCGKQQGYYTDRGRVYLQYGKPNQRSVQVSESNTYPYEIWQYYRLVDKTNGQFFTNRKFVFVNKNLADDCYMLVHSDMKGEINNERWRFEIMKRNSDGLQNIDNTQPNGSSNNQFDEIYANPR